MAESALMLSSASSFASQPLLSSFLLSFSSAQHMSFPAASLAPLADLCIRSGLSISTAATALATDASTTSGSKPHTPADADPSSPASAPWTLAVAVSPWPSTSLPPDGNSTGTCFTSGRRVPPLFTSPAYRLPDSTFYCTVTPTQADGSGRHVSSLPHPAHQWSPHILGRDAAYGPTPLYAHPSTVGKFVAGSPYYGSTLYSSYVFSSNPVSFVTSDSATIQDAVAPPPSKTDTWHVTVPHTFRARSIGRKRVGGSGGSGSDGWDGGMDGAGFSGCDPWSFDGSDFPVNGGGDGFGGGWGNSGGGGGGSWNGGGGGSSGGDPGAGGAGGEGGGGEDDPWWREWEQGGNGWRDADWWWLLQREHPTVPPVGNPSSVWSLVHMWAWQFSRNWRAGAWGVQRGASLLYRIACWLSLSRCFCHVLGTALAASASAPPALRRAAACIMANPQAAAPAPPAVAAAQKGLSLSSAVPAAVEGAWRGSLAQCCCFSGSLILALNAAGARWGPEGQGDVGEWE